ncbi:MAG TPA: PilZ domain-containing protein [Methylomirabilota bacterium]|nr:PilZ domain-containing protein [Methylomirabilota bacterium]
MKASGSDRRISRRHKHKTPLRVRIWKSLAPERCEESLDLSQHGVFFATDSPLREGETVEIFFKMPEEITTEPTTEWRCTGHVVRVERTAAEGGKVGIGVRFDCYEVSRGERP